MLAVSIVLVCGNKGEENHWVGEVGIAALLVALLPLFLCCFNNSIPNWLPGTSSTFDRSGEMPILFNKLHVSDTI